MPIYFLLTIALLISSSLAYAETDSAQRLESVQTEIESLNKDLSKKKANKEELFKLLEQQSRSVSEINRELFSLKNKISQNEAQLKTLQQQQAKQQQSYKQQLSAINNQIRSAYINAQPSYLKILLSQQDPARLGRSTVYYRYFHQARQQQLAEIDNILANLTDQQKQLFATQRIQQQLYEKQQQQQSALKRQTQRRQATLKQLDKDISSQDARLSLLREQEQSLQKLLQSLNVKEKGSTKSATQAKTKHTPFAHQAGKLSWPIKGKLLARYGSPRNLGKLTWKGIMIAAPTGKDIMAVAPGKVVFSDWLRGFGLLLIIDHGDQYMTLYGNNDTLLKQAGDNVTTGEIIAQSGNEGVRQHAGLYFEIRHKGNPTNPLKWLNKNS